METENEPETEGTKSECPCRNWVTESLDDRSGVIEVEKVPGR